MADGNPFSEENESGANFTEDVTSEAGVELEDTSGEDRITEPFNSALIRVDTRPMTIDLLITRIDHKELNLQPSFQREGGIWNEKTQSRLIESILIRIPLPAFYIDATDEEEWAVVDGLQRLTALKRFIIDGTLKLTNMEFMSELNGKTYSELSRQLQRRIKETQVTVYLIEKGTPSDVKFNIFKRINTGGQPLSTQEIRHALNQGKATEILERLSLSEEFQIATNKSIRDNRMTDRECVLRFFAFTINPYTNYASKEFDDFLNGCMGVMNHMSDEKLALIESRFKRAMITAYEIFGKEAFRKRYRIRGPRYPINKALFESWSVNLSQLDDQQVSLLKERKDRLMKNFIALMQTREFDASVSQGTGDIKKVICRFEEIREIIKETLS